MKQLTKSYKVAIYLFFFGESVEMIGVFRFNLYVSS